MEVDIAQWSERALGDAPFPCHESLSSFLPGSSVACSCWYMPRELARTVKFLLLNLFP